MGTSSFIYLRFLLQRSKLGFGSRDGLVLFGSQKDLNAKHAQSRTQNPPKNQVEDGRHRPVLPLTRAYAVPSFGV